MTLRQIFRRRCTVRTSPSGYSPGCSACNRSSSCRPDKDGSASNQECRSSVTLTRGSGGVGRAFEVAAIHDCGARQAFDSQLARAKWMTSQFMAICSEGAPAPGQVEQHLKKK